MADADTLLDEAHALPSELALLRDAMALVARRSPAVEYSEFSRNAADEDLDALDAFQQRCCADEATLLDRLAAYIDEVAVVRPTAATVLSRFFHVLIPPHASRAG